MAKFVSIGDSLTQGFQSGSISKTNISYPAMIARAIGLDWDDFRVPDFSGEGGLPLNLEDLMNTLARRYGSRINPFELPLAVGTVFNFLDDVEDFWERRAGNRPSPTGPLHHNLAVWGFEVGDADSLSEGFCRRIIPPPRDNVFRQVPEFSMYRTARRTLNPAFHTAYEELTQIGAAKQIASEEGGIENLILFLGPNNCLATTLRLNIDWSEDADLYRYAHERTNTLWTPEHFEKAYARIAPKIDEIGAKNVFVATVPHVTIPPVSRGVSIGSPERDAEGYYEYYTHFWIWDSEFKRNPDKYPHLVRQQVRLIDEVIDKYNTTIKKLVKARSNWHLVDLGKTLDQIAFRRSGGQPAYKFPQGLRKALAANPKTQHLVSGSGDVSLDTRYMRLDSSHRLRQGGVFSLDGIHPTTIGYGIVAHEFLKVFGKVWRKPGLTGKLDWTNIVGLDTLVTNPPINLENLKEIAGFLYKRGPLLDILREIGGLSGTGVIRPTA